MHSLELFTCNYLHPIHAVGATKRRKGRRRRKLKEAVAGAAAQAAEIARETSEGSAVEQIMPAASAEAQATAPGGKTGIAAAHQATVTSSAQPLTEPHAGAPVLAAGGPAPVTFAMFSPVPLCNAPCVRAAGNEHEVASLQLTPVQPRGQQLLSHGKQRQAQPSHALPQPQDSSTCQHMNAEPAHYAPLSLQASGSTAAGAASSEVLGLPFGSVIQEAARAGRKLPAGKRTQLADALQSAALAASQLHLALQSASDVLRSSTVSRSKAKLCHVPQRGNTVPLSSHRIQLEGVRAASAPPPGRSAQAPNLMLTAGAEKQEETLHSQSPAVPKAMPRSSQAVHSGNVTADVACALGQDGQLTSDASKLLATGAEKQAAGLDSGPVTSAEAALNGAQDAQLPGTMTSSAAASGEAGQAATGNGLMLTAGAEKHTRILLEAPKDAHMVPVSAPSIAPQPGSRKPPVVTAGAEDQVANTMELPSRPVSPAPQSAATRKRNRLATVSDAAAESGVTAEWDRALITKKLKLFDSTAGLASGGAAAAGADVAGKADKQKRFESTVGHANGAKFASRAQNEAETEEGEISGLAADDVGSHNPVSLLRSHEKVEVGDPLMPSCCPSM